MKVLMQVVALLDKPSTSSFGRVPFVARMPDGSLIAWIAMRGRRFGTPMDQSQLDDLVGGGHSMDVAEAGMTFMAEPPTAGSEKPMDVDAEVLMAGWLGTEFVSSVAALQAPMPDVSESFLRPASDKGSFWIEPASKILRRQQDFIRRVAPRAIKERSAALTSLMRWTLPDELETIAATWWEAMPGEPRNEVLRQAVQRVEMLRMTIMGGPRSAAPANYDQLLTVVRSIVEMHAARPDSGE